MSLLIFPFAGCEHICAWASQADIISISPADLVISAAAEDAIIPAKAVYRVHAGTAEDEVAA